MYPSVGHVCFIFCLHGDLEQLWEDHELHEHMNYDEFTREFLHDAYESGIGIQPQNGTKLKFNDCHVWLVSPSGEICDPTPATYPYERHYRPFPCNRDKYFRHYWSQYLLLEKEERRQLVHELYENPKPMNCGFNAIAFWKHHKDHKIVVGSLGFDIGNGRILWEYG